MKAESTTNVVIKNQKNGNLVSLNLNITKGMFLAMLYSLENHGTLCSDDLYSLIMNAMPDKLNRELFH